MTELRLVTANVDFALRPFMVKQDLKFITDHADIITFQEAKRVNIDALIADNDWVVFQPMQSEAAKGSGVAWRKSVAKQKAYGRTVGTTPFGRGMLTRYIVWARLEIDGQVITVASLHMPPKRFWGFLYNNMLKNVATFIGQTSSPIIIGGDWNKRVHQADDLRALAGRFDGNFFGTHIDGFLLISKNKWRVASVKKLRDTRSDHDPVQIKIIPRG